MAEPTFLLEGSLPRQADGGALLNQKLLGAIRSTQGGSGVSDPDLISLANLSDLSFLGRLEAGNWRARELIAPTSGFFIDDADAINGNPVFRLDNTIGSPPYIKGILSRLEGTGSAGGIAVLDQVTAPPFGPAISKRTLGAGTGIAITNGSGVAGNPSVAINIDGLTEEATPDDQDYLAIYDISAAGHRKVRRGDFLAGLTASGATAKAARISASPSHTPSVTQNVHTAHTFDTEDFDTDTIGDLGTNNTRLTCKTAGRYVICGDVQFDSDNTGNRREIWVRKNGSIRIATQAIFAAQFLGPEMNIITVVELAVNDYVELMVFTSGTNGGLAAANHFEMMAYT